jgi:hypothetical protein
LDEARVTLVLALYIIPPIRQTTPRRNLDLL